MPDQLSARMASTAAASLFKEDAAQAFSISISACSTPPPAFPSAFFAAWPNDKPVTNAIIANTLSNLFIRFSSQVELLKLPFVLQHIQACIPITHVHESICRHENIGRLRGESDVRSGIDQLLRSRRHPGCDFFGSECVLDIEHPNACIVVRRKDSFFTPKTTRTVFVQIMWAEHTERTKVSILRRRKRGNGNGIFRSTHIDDKGIERP